MSLRYGAGKEFASITAEVEGGPPCFESCIPQRGFNSGSAKCGVPGKPRVQSLRVPRLEAPSLLQVLTTAVAVVEAGRLRLFQTVAKMPPSAIRARVEKSGALLQAGTFSQERSNQGRLGNKSRPITKETTRGSELKHSKYIRLRDGSPQKLSDRTIIASRR